MSRLEKQSLGNRWWATKRAVRMVVMHMDSFPPESNRSFKSTLRKVTTEAVERLQTTYGFPEDKTITVSTIANHKQTTVLEETLKLPSDLLEVWCKLFDKK